ncbi:uncharacterized protein LOC121760408 [Salvia splendens]|uniref:uncharacterized protein LOC121760408 n=1 Tax=Salvia splendens TaxID=180675 RepID=UPI001C25DE4F|nr:uncharacterized protein LOC121760408 [Salvia splendens]
MASIRFDVCGSFESPIVISDDVLDERNRSIVNESSFDSSNLNEDGGKVDNSVNTGGGPPVFRLYGQNYHLIGSLLPVDGCEPKFAQLYVYDTDDEINYRITSVRQRDAVNNLHSEIVSDLQHMLDKENVLVKSFRMAKEKTGLENQPNVSLRLLGKRGRDGRTHNLPSVSEVAMLVVGDFDEALGDRDIVVVKKSGQLQRISELHPSYLPLQYPLLFPYGEDGYKEDIGFSRNSSSSSTHRKSISPKEFFAFRLHERISEYSILLFGRRLFQQFVVDAYTMIETDGSRHGKRITLPSSFVGGARYMVQNYQDAMAICRWIGYPNLFITFTCNPKWPEICRYLASKGLKSDDRPDIICRIFKVKLDNLIRDLKSKKIFGVVKAVVYTVEFQKRGLPHAHILLFLSNEDKHPKPQRIDEIISAELPDQATDPHYHEYVKEFMMHGPCGVVRKSSHCMLNGRCSKYFPKKYLAATNIDDDGYPAYRRRDNGRVVMKDGVPLDNRYVVPHNRFLLMKYDGHINVEWCNQSRSIKYLFKYINKGYDRVTTSFFQSGAGGTERCIDEVSLYYNCRYISSCEAAWRIFGFEIQYKDPPVERLSFHLPDQQHVVFDEADDLDTVLNRKTIHESKFLAWMEANKIYSQGRDLTYGEFPTKFVWKKNRWEPRKQRYSIGRLFYVAPGSGDMYYLRCLLNIVKGASSYEDIRCVNGVQYDTFRDACFALGLLDDDKEYVDGIVEASFWASAHSLRLLFVSLLTSESISRPDFVWQRCMILSEDEIQNVALAEIEKLLQNLGKTLRDFHAREYLESISKFTGEQLSVHDTIMSSVHSNYGGIFFVYGYGGNKPFGGKTVVFGGDFRQILPVVPKGSRQDVVNATINSSYLWKSCTVLRLTKNMRLLNTENVHEASKLKEFSSWVASIGDGVIGGPNDGEVAIQLPIDIVLPNSGDPLRTIVSNVYPSYMNPEELISCLHGRTILAPTLEVVDEVNQFMIYLDQSQGRVYFSSDSISNSDSTSNGLAEIHSVEFLNKLKCSGTPNHELLLKVGTPVMLLRNIDLSNGLCNGTRLIITRLGDYVLEGQVLGGHNIGHKVLIPRMSLIPSDPRLPFKFQRRQFPLAVSYAMTINKSQGQSLSHVGLFLRKHVFNHGQLYVAISRVTSREGLKILVCKDEVDEGNGDTTVNIVYKEVFQNL